MLYEPQRSTYAAPDKLIFFPSLSHKKVFLETNISILLENPPAIGTSWVYS